MLAFLEIHLVHAGHDVTLTGDGKVALEYLGRHRFDLVITDIYMPEVDGIEIIRRAREANLVGRLIAISSANAGVDLLPTALALGATRTLPKPFTAEQLLETVNAVLQLPVSQTGPERWAPTPANLLRAK